MTQPQPDLAEYCEGSSTGPATRYAPAELVLMRPSGETLRFACAERAPAWVARPQGRYLVLKGDEWEARGGGYPGRMLGG